MHSGRVESFSFSFLIAIVLHLLLIAVVSLSLSLEPERSKTKIVTVMQATLLDETQLLHDDDETLVLENVAIPKKISHAEKRRLAQLKKQALRLEQVQRQALVSLAAQQLLTTALSLKRSEVHSVLERQSIEKQKPKVSRFKKVHQKKNKAKKWRR